MYKSEKNSQNNKGNPIYFYGHTKAGDYGCFSQFYPCHFTENGITYQSAEQYMMAGKAKTMGDSETFEKIMTAPSAQDAKKLGRSVTPYDNAKWSDVRFDVVKQGNLLKVRYFQKTRQIIFLPFW